jgi:hypothetical protein
MFIFDPPATAIISFSDIFSDQSDNKQYGFRLPTVTEARSNIRAALKEMRAAENGERDYLRLAKVRGGSNCGSSRLTFSTSCWKNTFPRYRESWTA